MINKYIKIPTNILSIKNLSPKAKLLYGLIDVMSYQSGFCYATNKFLANKLHTSTRTITRLITELETLNLIKCYYEIDNVRKIYIIDKNVYDP